MKFQDIKTGTVFTIGETPSYPKLKTDTGYVDMRDEIVNDSPNGAVLGSECRELTNAELEKQLEGTPEEIAMWIKVKKVKFLKD